MPEGIGASPTPICDEEARRDVRDVRHELRAYIAVNDIKSENAIKEAARRSDVVAADAAAARAAITSNFNGKHGELKEAICRIESMLKWAGSLLITLILGVLGWSLVQQITNNEQQKKELQSQIKLLEQQDRTRVLQQPEQRLLAPSAAETALPAAGR